MNRRDLFKSVPFLAGLGAAFGLSRPPAASEVMAVNVEEGTLPTASSRPPIGTQDIHSWTNLLKIIF